MQWPRELGKAPTKKPQVVELPDGEWAIAVETDWPSRGKFFWAGKGGRPWCPNMGKALTFEAFKDADMELSKMTTTKAQMIAKLVEAGHEDLAEQFMSTALGRNPKAALLGVKKVLPKLKKAVNEIDKWTVEEVDKAAEPKNRVIGDLHKALMYLSQMLQELNEGKASKKIFDIALDVYHKGVE